jgi:protein ImuB
MLGAEAVLRPILVGGRSPVDQVRLVPFGDPLPIGLPAPKGLGAAGVSSGAASAPWPGCLPAPSPAVVLAGDTGKAGKNGDGVEGGGGGEGGEGGDDVEDGDGEVELLDISGRRVTVDGRGALSAPPRYVVTGRGSGAVAAWAGPWPADERWWDGVKRRRRARLQLLTDDGEAYLVSLERGRWHLEGIYD